MPLDRALAQRNGAFGAAVDSDAAGAARSAARRAPHHRRRHHRDRARVIKSEPDKLASGIGFGPRVIISEAALRATGLLQPGSLVRWNYRVRLARRQRPRRAGRRSRPPSAQLPDAGWEIRSRTNASPALERNVERFTQFLTLVGLTALLVGGVGVANAVKSHHRPQARRDRDAEGARRDRRPGVRDLSVAGAAAVGDRRRDRARARRGAAVRHRGGVRRDHAAADRAGAACRPSWRWRSVYGLLTALAFALWPLGRAHDVPVSALFRDAVAPERRWPRRRYVVATALVVAALAAHRRRRSPTTARSRRSSSRAAAAVFVDAAARGAAADGDRAPAAAPALTRAAARHRQHPPAGRADADHRAVARPWASRCSSP